MALESDSLWFASGRRRVEATGQAESNFISSSKFIVLTAINDEHTFGIESRLRKRRGWTL